MSTSCAMLTVGKSNHSVAGTQFFVDLEILLGYLEKSWSVRASDGEFHRKLWQTAEWMSLRCWLE